MISVIIWENNKKRLGVNVLSSKVEYIENYAVDAYLFHQGTYYKSYNLLGSHHIIHNGAHGVRFVLWAENVREIQVVGDFNNWDPDKNLFTENQTDGSYSVEVILPSEQEYQFRYLWDGVQWFNEPEADKQVDTYFAGSKNSVIKI